MKKIILVLSLFISGHISFAQWNLNGNILENVNSGDVVISGSSSLRLYGRLITYYPKSNSPLGGEFLGTSGWWGFRTDTDNRFHVDIYSANSPRSAFNIDQAGNVGIGNGIPSSQLHLTSNTDHAFRITRSSGMYGFRIFRNAQQGSVLFQNTDDSNNPGTRIRFEEGGSGWKNVLINPDEGNVGIGTISPWAKLHVVGQSGDSGTGLVRLDAGSANASLRIGINTDYAWIQSHGSRPLYINDFGNNTILNTQGGNVGVGTNNPQTRLDIAGNANVQGGIDVSGEANFTGGRLSQNGNLPNDNNAAFFNSSPEGYGLYSQGGSNSKYAFHFLNQSGSTIMYGAGNGNIGIGTTSPDAKLTVKGTIHTQEVRVDLLGAVAPDYVFEETYNLQSLEEVETYIKQNKHLPEIPSAKEMEENGVNLKEMNLLLLKKVEELTLHVIELKKEVNELKKNK